LDCTKCGSDNRSDAQFCKKCGADLTRQQSVISRLNGQINLLSVFIGLIFSIIILFIGALLFGRIITSGSNYIPIYIGIILAAMAFFGSIVASILGSKNSSEGYTNGFFLSLVIIVFGAFILGILLF
jgi:positive regulator of sigma E activity